MLRLAELDEQLLRSAGRYVYDWLVALYTRANKNAECQRPQGVSETDKGRLDALFSP